MPPQDETQEQNWSQDGASPGLEPTPGVVLLFSSGAALCSAVPLGRDGLVLGRGAIPGVSLEDGQMSRRHARVSYEEGDFFVEDLGSRNGFSLDGERAAPRARQGGSSARILRLGQSIFLLHRDVRPFLAPRPRNAGDQVVGPTLAGAWGLVAAAAASGETLHVTGESGSGKELAARAFHLAGPGAGGPFVAVNCAAIPEGVAERLLFGAKKGAFSGAHADADGYVQAADRGTLFLDEVGELDLQVQAKLLRVLESREVLSLGASRPRQVELRVVSATHHELRSRVAEKRFREDLYFRIGRPQVRIPPLRERLEDLPLLAIDLLRRQGSPLSVQASFIEGCLLRPWPGNVRELLVEVKEAAGRAAAEQSGELHERHLDALAGIGFDDDPEGGGAAGEEGAEERTPAPFPPREVIEEALRTAGGQVATAARRLGLHRNQLRRWLAKNHLEPRSFQTPDASSPPSLTESSDDPE